MFLLQSQGGLSQCTSASVVDAALVPDEGDDHGDGGSGMWMKVPFALNPYHVHPPSSPAVAGDRDIPEPSYASLSERCPCGHRHAVVWTQWMSMLFLMWTTTEVECG